MQESERLLRKGTRSFFDLGTALLPIKEHRLYRATHATFEDYCHDVWKLDRSYAWRVIAAAERVRLLGPNAAMLPPAHESQVRPMLKFKPEAFPKLWAAVVDAAKGSKLTASLVEQVVGGLAQAAGHLPARAPRLRRSRTGKPQLGQLLILIDQARRSAQKTEMEQTLEFLDRIERILFGP